MCYLNIACALVSISKQEHYIVKWIDRIYTFFKCITLTARIPTGGFSTLAFWPPQEMTGILKTRVSSRCTDCLDFSNRNHPGSMCLFLPFTAPVCVFIFPPRSVTYFLVLRNQKYLKIIAQNFYLWKKISLWTSK